MFDVLPKTHPWKETKLTNMKQWLLRNAIVNKFNIFFLLRFPTSTPPCSSSSSRWRWLVAASGRGYTWWCIDRDVWLFAWGDVTSDLMRWVGHEKNPSEVAMKLHEPSLLVLRTNSTHDSNIQLEVEKIHCYWEGDKQPMSQQVYSGPQYSMEICGWMVRF